MDRGKIMQKYKCINKGMKDMAIAWENKTRIDIEIKSEIQTFYERDDNSSRGKGNCNQK